jgi:hypothetical protein
MRPRARWARVALPIFGVALPFALAGVLMACTPRAAPVAEEVRATAEARATMKATAEITAVAVAAKTLPPADIRPPTFPTARDIVDVWGWLSAHPDAFGTNEPDANGPGAGGTRTEAHDYLLDEFFVTGEVEVVAAHYLELLRGRDWRLHPGSPSVDRGPIPKPGPTRFANEVMIDASQSDLAVRMWLRGGRLGSSSGPVIVVVRFEIWRCAPGASFAPCAGRPAVEGALGASAPRVVPPLAADTRRLAADVAEVVTWLAAYPNRSTPGQVSSEEVGCEVRGFLMLQVQTGDGVEAVGRWYVDELRVRGWTVEDGYPRFETISGGKAAGQDSVTIRAATSAFNIVISARYSLATDGRYLSFIQVNVSRIGPAPPSTCVNPPPQ